MFGLCAWLVSGHDIYRTAAEINFCFKNAKKAK
jgi:hypothetical protein